MDAVSSGDAHSLGQFASNTAMPTMLPRQIECLTWAQEGKSATDIGQILGISGRTVEWHLARACAALSVRTRVQAVIRARRLGLLPESVSERLL